ncbi:hypothetical protein PC128_g23879 [Phytophthora cactorum]|nr:hypothetical protein PC128_g23879 [Phytophthora cactorum]
MVSNGASFDNFAIDPVVLSFSTRLVLPASADTFAESCSSPSPSRLNAADA